LDLNFPAFFSFFQLFSVVSEREAFVEPEEKFENKVEQG
jgi:hypothetical protein